ncbi:MAG: hypothetical protein J6D03_06600 [Clostridia bacterium]|nr:hypothetical protein [Clostridia bacterium]
MKILSKEVEKENKKGADTMYTIQELIKEHVQEKCRYCTKENCDGIHVTITKETRCEKDED